MAARASKKKSASKKAGATKAKTAKAGQRKLLVVDAANAIYRAFFAIPNLRAPDGTPTNAVYGFVNMLSKLLREEAPDFVAIAMDPPGGSFRKDIFSGYKANRDAQPEDLSVQLPLVREALEALALPVLEVPGFEADDVIATLVEIAPEDVEIQIVSSDKDLMQLVTSKVTLLDGMKDRRYGPAEVEERFGVPPEQILDLRALIGDPSDNIPGVKGIGEKGAAKLIQEWGTLDELLAKAGDVKAKRAREALLEHADDARLSKELSTLRSDVEIAGGFDALLRREADLDVLRALYERLGFTRLVEALAADGVEGDATTAADFEIELELPADLAALKKALGALPDDAAIAMCAVAGPGSVADSKWVGLAIAAIDASKETPTHAIYVAVADSSAQQDSLPMGEGPPPIAEADVIEALEAAVIRGGATRPWGGIATKRLHALFAERGMRVDAAFFDVEIASFLLDPAGVHDVPALAQQRLGFRLQSWEELAGRGAKATPAEEIPVAELAKWAGSQACAAAGLEKQLRASLESDELLDLYESVEMPLTAVLSRMECGGVRIDEAKLAALSEEYSKDLERIEAEIFELAGESFAVNSPKQLQVILFEKLELPPIKKTKTGYSTDESVLEQLALQHDLPARVLAWRRLSKLKSTYLDALPPLVSEKSGRVHPTFLQTGAATGRLASTNPNVQNIPIRTPEGVRIREAFIPEEGASLVSADYSQVELRILAHYSGDESLINAFENGEDIHRRTAAEVAGIDPEEVDDDQRARAKAVNFGIIYGSSAFGLANQLGIPQGEAQETIDAYFARYDGVRRFLDETTENAKASGYVTTLLGRRRYLPDLGSRNRVLRQSAERMAVNTVIQGSEADLIKRAMVELDTSISEAGMRSRMILQVHDELVFEVPKAEIEALTALAVERMKGVYSLRVPLDVDVGVGDNWRQAH